MSAGVQNQQNYQLLTTLLNPNSPTSQGNFNKAAPRRSQTLQDGTSRTSFESKRPPSPLNGSSLQRRVSILDAKKRRPHRQNTADMTSFASQTRDTESQFGQQTLNADNFSAQKTEMKSRNVLLATEEMFFDQRLKAKAALKDFKNIDQQQTFKLTVIRIMQVILTILFTLVVPFIQAGNWCLDPLESERGQTDGLFLDCDTVAVKLKVPFTGGPTAVPAFTASLDILCLISFSLIKFFKYKRSKADKMIKYRYTAFAVLVATSLIDIIVALALFQRQYIANILRPFIVILCFRSQTDFFSLVGLNVKDSIAMLFSLLIWVAYFAAFGNFLFGNLFEGIAKFDTFANSFWAMFVCLTTENFPDVMLLAQSVNALYCLFFVAFILVGCFFLTSVLLAVIFDNFKNRIEILQRKKVSYRMQYIDQFFDAFDEGGNGWLTLKETKAFFAAVCDLNYRKSSHRKLFTKILKIVDPEDNKFVLKERIMDFFEISGFQIIAQLCQEQMQFDSNCQASVLSGQPVVIVEGESEDGSNSDPQSQTKRQKSQTNLSAKDAQNQTKGTRSSILTMPQPMPEIKEEESEIFSIVGDLEVSMREMVRNRQSWQKRGISIFESFYYILGRYTFIFLTFILAETHTVLINIDNLEGRFANLWVWFVICINLVLLVDLILHIICYGVKTIIKLRKEYIWESILQLTFFIATICYFATPMTNLTKQIEIVEVIALILLFRLPLISTLLAEIKAFRVIFDTIKRMLSPFMSVLFSFYLVIFIFNAIGIAAYGGLVTLEAFTQIDGSVDNQLYYLLNFNDAYSGVMTLFSILVSNNWNSTTEMYCALTGTKWPRWYFSTFYVVTIMVILNIVVSFVLEIYSVSLEESQTLARRTSHASKLRKMAPNQQELDELIRKAALYDQLSKTQQSSSPSSSDSNDGGDQTPQLNPQEQVSENDESKDSFNASIKTESLNEEEEEEDEQSNQQKSQAISSRNAQKMHSQKDGSSPNKNFSSNNDQSDLLLPSQSMDTNVLKSKIKRKLTWDLEKSNFNKQGNMSSSPKGILRHSNQSLVQKKQSEGSSKFDCSD